MPTAFTDGADFTGMTLQDRLCIGAVVHEVFVAVDEQGTEAAAATAVIMRPTSARLGGPIELTVDRPFLFLVHDIETGTPLFLGRVTDPGGG
jgi:serpin B